MAVSDVSGAIYDKNGLNIADVKKYIIANRLLKGYPKAEMITNEKLLALDVDILIPAAIDGVVTKENMHTINARLIAEGANGPVNREAVSYLTEKGVEIIPDILCNAGGVIVSYFEWVQGLAHFFWDLDQINQNLHDILKRAFNEVNTQSKKYNVPMKKAAMVAALARLDTAMRVRGLFP